jgi:3-deoxy-D-manno-octulosonic-acid transferase
MGLLLYILSLPVMLYKQRKPRYEERIPARYFLKNNPKFSQCGIWFHSCSLGETRGLQPIIDRIDDVINMSVVTNTAFTEAKNIAKGEARYLPYEIFLPFWITKQKILIGTEAEYWYFLFLYAKKKGIPTMLMNARISDKHYEGYKRYRWFYKKILDNIDIIFAQSEKDKQRLEELGATNVQVTGNSKLVNLPKTTKTLTKPEGRMIVASSTHAPEERLVLDAWQREQGRLVMVPRHPERFDEVDQLIKQRIKGTTLSYHRYSQQAHFDADIVLVDRMGELINIYAISDVVILGGGFVYGSGGHNPIEAAYFNNILITGELIYNQTSLYDCLEHYRVIKNEELAQTLTELDQMQACRITQNGTIEPIMAYINHVVYGREDGN